MDAREPKVPASDVEFELLVRAYWARREPSADEVTLTVRRAGKMVRFVYLPVDAPAVTLLPDASA